MDLVDIDKVLDDFELNEDQKIDDNNDVGGKLPGHHRRPLTTLTTDYARKPTAAATSSQAATAAAVNVSNVFHSLNEYVNVEIDTNPSAKYDFTDDDDGCDESTAADDTLSSVETSPITDSSSSPAYVAVSDDRCDDDDDEDDVQQRPILGTMATDTLRNASGDSLRSSSVASSSSHTTTTTTTSSLSSTSAAAAVAASSTDDSPSSDHYRMPIALDYADDDATTNKSSVAVPTTISERNANCLSSISSYCLNDDDEMGNSSISDAYANEMVVQQQQPTEEAPSIDEPVVADAQMPAAATVPVLGAATEKQAIGFESTMDDVSDTELESYLQELELETGGGGDTAAAAATAEPVPVDVTALHQNADSFSQASTVEFADDVRLHSDFEQPIEVAAAEAATHETTAVPVGDDDGSSSPYEKPLQRPTQLAIPKPFCHDSISEDISPSEWAPAPPPPSVEQHSSGSDDCLAAVEPSAATTTTTVLPSTAAAAPAVAATQIGQIQPYWVPDKVTNFCMQCNLKFSLIKRRHHCRACGQVLCSTCCSLKAKLAYMGAATEARICVQCDLLLNQRDDDRAGPSPPPSKLPSDAAAAALVANDVSSDPSTDSSTIGGTEPGGAGVRLAAHPNPNNPMEYCSVIPPMQQIAAGGSAALPPISVMVPVGVLKREGAPKTNKTVIFSDGIRPGCDLTDLDTNWDFGKTTTAAAEEKVPQTQRRPQTPTGSPPVIGAPAQQSRVADASTTAATLPTHADAKRTVRNNKVRLPPIDADTHSFIPAADELALPPIYAATSRTDYRYVDVANTGQLMERLQRESLKFAIQRNFYVWVKIVNRKYEV